jgi:thiol-disulfide isomerase/thioredoxin
MFPTALKWLNVATLRMDKQRGHPVLLEFWDFCDPASLRTLPYLDAWDERYGEAGLRTILVQAPGFAPGQDPDTVKAAVERLGITHPVLLDPDLRLWQIYENQGWPSRYLFNRDLRLFEVHFGEGGYHETEAAIQELLGVSGEPVPYVRAQDDPDARIVVPTADVEGPYSGPYEAGAVAVVLEVGEDGGEIVVNGATRSVDYTGAHTIIEHDHPEAGVLDLELGDGVRCLATLFTPGLA